MERKLAEEQGLQYHAIRSGKLRRYGRGVAELFDVRTVSANARDAWRFSRGLSDARKLLREIKPDVVFVKGGYVGLPVGMAARRLKIPLVIHESDTVMGLTNRLLAPYAQVVATGFPVDHFKNVKTSAHLIPTGNPIRQEMLSGDRNRAIKHFGLSTNRQTLLFIGGSSGAHAINETLFAALPNLTESYNIIHQTGEKDIDAAMFQRQRLLADRRDRYAPQAYMHQELADAYALADIVITRCGANVLAELAALAKPSLLIPLPTSANNHQLHNAHYLVQRGAARMLEQDKLNPIALRAAIDRLAESESDKKYLASAFKRLAITDAADRLAEIVLEAGA
ncbi:MAG: UDP-N-acetylglucosamine--N-acetylmuramyl-(pentapeptide) pyrophosphoryl-undecaprenol [Patescibacteria group bacterium]|nr:UDP-N-acetylglucosamine--N-acetylmuramyl-(pentapeptide) pyrophosphoryl-undecaprenol [Patescibacteria group bacterium]